MAAALNRKLRSLSLGPLSFNEVRFVVARPRQHCHRHRQRHAAEASELTVPTQWNRHADTWTESVRSLRIARVQRSLSSL